MSVKTNTSKKTLKVTSDDLTMRSGSRPDSCVSIPVQDYHLSQCEYDFGCSWKTEGDTCTTQE